MVAKGKTAASVFVCENPLDTVAMSWHYRAELVVTEAVSQNMIFPSPGGAALSRHKTENWT